MYWLEPFKSESISKMALAIFLLGKFVRISFKCKYLSNNLNWINSMEENKNSIQFTFHKKYNWLRISSLFSVFTGIKQNAFVFFVCAEIVSHKVHVTQIEAQRDQIFIVTNNSFFFSLHVSILWSVYTSTHSEEFKYQKKKKNINWKFIFRTRINSKSSDQFKWQIKRTCTRKHVTIWIELYLPNLIFQLLYLMFYFELLKSRWSNGTDGGDNDADEY